MRILFLILLAACEPMAPSKDGATPSEGEGEPLVSLTASFATTFSVPSRDQIYSVAPAPQMGDGCAVVGDPYYGSFTGAVSLVCPSDGSEILLPDDASASWMGSAENQALGCDVEVSTLPDGTPVVGTSEFHDPTYKGRLLVWPLAADLGVAADVALVDIVGDVSGDGNHGGYLGTTTIVADGRLLTSQTNTVPYLLGAEYAPSLTLDDLQPLVEGGSVYCGRNCGGFAGYGVSVGDDGTAWSSFGGILQHLDPEGVPDWYAAPDGDGAGEYAFPETDVTLWSATTRLLDGSPVLSVLSRETRADGEVAYARIFDAQTGEESADLSNVYGVVQGQVSGTTWTAYGVMGCDPSGAVDASGDCAFGYIHISTDAGDEIDLSLPYEAGEFPASGCLVQLESAGDGWLTWFCKDLTVGGMVKIVAE